MLLLGFRYDTEVTRPEITFFDHVRIAHLLEYI